MQEVVLNKSFTDLGSLGLCCASVPAKQHPRVNHCFVEGPCSSLSHSLQFKLRVWEFIQNLIVQDPRAPKPYLLSDGQNMYNRVVLVCTVNVYIPASLGRRPIHRYQVLQVPKGMFDPYDWSDSLKNIIKSPLNIADKNKVSDCK